MSFAAKGADFLEYKVNSLKTLPRTRIHVIDNRCKGCGFCIEFCPEDVLGFSEKPNQKGYHPPTVRKSENCIQCNKCEFVCPEFAIFLSNVVKS
jgi:2-oxoglutarate ferredoxin oxidoreductase subunit delta